MRTVAIVQARMSSQRLPGKVLADLGGRPALGLLLDRLARATELEAIIVATSDDPSDDPIADFCERRKAPVHRGPLKDVLRRYREAADGAQAEAVVRVTGDCPLIDPDVVDALVRYAAEHGLRYAGLGGEFPHGLDCEVFSHEALQEADDRATDDYEREYVTPYMKTRPHEFPTQAFEPIRGMLQERWTLDYEDDLFLLRALVDALGESAVTAGHREIFAIVEAHPDLREINAHRVTSRSTASVPSFESGDVRPRAVVVLGCDWMTSDIIRGFREAGFHVIGVDRDPTTRANVNTFVNASLSLGGDSDMLTRPPSGSEHSVLAALKEFAFEAVITDKEVALPLALALKPESFRPFIEHQLLDKAHQYRFLSARGVSVPDFFTADELDRPRSMVSGPQKWIIKPRFGSGGRGLRVVAALPRRSEIGSDDLVQQHVEGNLIGVVVNRHRGSCEILGAIERVEGGALNHFSARDPEHLASHVRDAAQRVGDAIPDFTGTLSIEFIASSERVWLLEVSPTVPSRLSRIMLDIAMEPELDGSITAVRPANRPPAVFGSWLFAGRTSDATLRRFTGSVMGAEFYPADPGRGLLYADGSSRAIGAIVVRQGTSGEVESRVREFLAAARVLTSLGESLPLRL